MNNVNILSEKATNDLLGFSNVVSQAFFVSILALGIRTLGTTSKSFFHINILLLVFKLNILGTLQNNK
jgi:hypothetical protein